MFTEGENHLMFDENKEKQFILQLFNLEYSDVQDVSCIRAGNTVIIDITLASDPVPCPVCGKTYYEHNPFVFKSMKISALTVYNILNDLKNYNETFSSVAKRYYISSTTVASIFDSHVDMKRKKLPEMINFDEVYAFRSDDSKYVCMLLDFKTHDPVDAASFKKI